MASIDSSVVPACAGRPSVATAAVSPEISASSPRPSTFLVMVEDLLRQLAVALRPGAVRIVKDDGLPERRRLAEPHVARDDRPVNPVGKELTSLVRDLLGEADTRVVHGE